MDSDMLADNWNKVCAAVASSGMVDASQVNAFFSRLEPQAMSEGFLMLTADNDFIKSWVEQHYLAIIKQTLDDMYQVPFTVVVEVDPRGAAAPAAQAPMASPAAQPEPVPAPSPEAGATNPFPAATPAPSMAPAPEPALPVAAAHQADPAFGAPTSLQQAAGTSGAGAGAFPVTATTAPAGAPMAPAGGQPSPGSQPPGASMTAPDLALNGQDPGATGMASSLTFENYVIGESNKMAYSLAVEVAEIPGRPFLNPLFIYGKSGLGKTHLMRAIQNYICATQPHLKTIYVDSAELVNDYMDAVGAHDKEKGSYKKFKRHYEEADVLLIDDIEFLQNKKETLNIVFQIFNQLIAQGRQIVLSADRAPKNIDIDERYHSRFNNGATIDIQPPEIETKLGIVKSFVGEYRRNGDLGDVAIPEDIQIYLAENSSSNIRELKSAIIKVISHIKFFEPHSLTVDDVRALLKDHFSGGATKNLTIKDIQKVVREFFKVSQEDLISDKRSRHIVYARDIAIYLCRQLLDVPYATIGEQFDRNHSTILYSFEKIEKKMQSDRGMQEELEELKHLIRES